MNDHTKLRDQLLTVEPMSTDVRERILKETNEMLTKELTPTRKIVFGVASVFALGSAAVCGFLALTEPELPTLARVGLGTGTLFGLIWFTSLVAMLRKGVMDMRKDPRRIAQMVWVFTLLMTIFFLAVAMTSPDPAKGLLMVGQSLVFLISAAVYWLNFRIEEAELNLKERLLRLELQLAESHSEK